MAQLDVLRSDAKGRTRPVPPWKRYDAAMLRLNRLASQIEDEAGRWAAASGTRLVLEQAAEAVRSAAIEPTDPTST